MSQDNSNLQKYYKHSKSLIESLERDKQVLEIELKSHDLKVPMSSADSHQNRVMTMIGERMKNMMQKMYESKFKVKETQTDIMDVTNGLREYYDYESMEAPVCPTKDAEI